LGVEIAQEPLTPEEIILKNELMKKYEDLHWNEERNKHFKIG
jgi:hypothetical protein